ncbi:MAG: MBL fold metallo-hydrolase [Puniceicoccales bacterium]|jgi:glyoxylase-like metal-dependent hydrolase (beta-lactamase superfamily II)|nr:MBL fold metallo-hydrolase [Puniceicoccales bacterium]
MKCREISSDGDVTVRITQCGHIDTNVGFIENRARGEALLIDAPFGAFDASVRILSAGVKPVAVLFTHCHWDHIGDAHIFRKLGAKMYAHRLDRPWIEHPQMMALVSGIDEQFVPCAIDVDVDDGDVLDINGWLRIMCRWCPGHAAGDLIFHMENLRCVFTGDTLFRGCIGRTDLPGGDEKLLISGIRDKIFRLPDDTIVIPGHGGTTTVCGEKIGNESLM